MDLQMGANAPVAGASARIRLALPSGAEIDVTALVTYAGDKVRGDGDMCFFNQASVHGGAVVLSRPSPAQAELAIDFARLPADAEKVVLTATIDGSQTFGSLSGALTISLDDTTIQVPTSGRSEKALILAEVYKRNGQWKIRNVSQGFNGGLAALAGHFGVSIAEAAPAPAPKPAPAPAAAPAPAPAPAAKPVNLSKVTLTKTESKVNLKKDDGRFGKIRINLNWNQKPKKAGFLGFGGSRGMDLDVGAFIEDRAGHITAVQALGNTFGDFNRFPFVKLLGDDRTGAVTDGVWLEINGDQWASLQRVLIYAFIYEGAPNWAETDGMVRVLVPGQPEIEVKMNEYGSQKGMCAVALLENDNGQIRVSREVTFHTSHPEMDNFYNWGLQWRAGRK